MDNKKTEHLDIKKLRNRWAEDHCTVHVKKGMHMRTEQDEKHDKQFKANCCFFDQEYEKISAKERSLVEAAIIATMNQLFMDNAILMFDNNTEDLDPRPKGEWEKADDRLASMGI